MVLKSFDLAFKKTNDEGVVHVKAVLALIMLQDSMKREMHGNVHNDDGTHLFHLEWSANEQCNTTIEFVFSMKWSAMTSA